MALELVFWKVLGIIGILVLLIELVDSLSNAQSKKRTDANTYEHDYIINLLIAFETELKTDKPRHEIIDKYAVALTAFMNGWRR
ncbi:MAG: hypothetical protein ACO1N8_06430 [Methylophilus sp.]